MLNLPHAPATARNREAIFNILSDQLKNRSTLLEVASGTGEHAAWMAKQLPLKMWQPSDRQIENLKVIDAYNATNKNVLPAIELDVLKKWPQKQYDLILCINMIHIAPWNCCEGLLRNTVLHLNKNGLLFLYGPFKINGKHTSESNRNFDQHLRQQNPNWGVRNLQTIIQKGSEYGLEWQKTIPMPANNHSVIFKCSLHY